MNVIDEELRYATKIISNLKDCNKSLQDECSSQVKSFDRERRTWNRTLKQINVDNQKIRSNAIQLINEVKRLKSENTSLISRLSREQISYTKYKTKYEAQLRDIKLLQSITKKLENKLALVQKNSTKKDSEILSLKSKITESEIELERLKSDAISRVLPLGEAISGGGEGPSLISSAIVEPLDLLKKNIANFDVISAVGKPKPDFSKFLKRRKNMDQTERIDVHQFSDTINKANNEAKPQIPDSSRSTNMKSSISEGSHVGTSQIVEIKDFSEDTVSKTDFIGNDQSHTIKTEMAEIFPVGIIPIVGSNLFSPKFMYAVLAFLIVVVIWLIIVKPISEARKKDKFFDDEKH
nr:4390_t:CDS:1 [Entrophospora candida]